MHIYFFEQAITLLTVAGFAGSYEIFPRALPTTGTRYHVIERQITAMLATVLAHFIDPQQDIGAIGLQHHARNADIREQLHHDRSLQIKTTAPTDLIDHLPHAFSDQVYV